LEQRNTKHRKGEKMQELDGNAIAKLRIGKIEDSH
jgi:hypothetical protein